MNQTDLEKEMVNKNIKKGKTFDDDKIIREECHYCDYASQISICEKCLENKLELAKKSECKKFEADKKAMENKLERLDSDNLGKTMLIRTLKERIGILKETINDRINFEGEQEKRIGELEKRLVDKNPILKIQHTKDIMLKFKKKIRKQEERIAELKEKLKPRKHEEGG